MQLVIKYRLGFNNSSDDYAYLISQILKDIDANVIKTDDEIIIYIDGSEEDIKSAFSLLGERLPLSLYLSSQSVEEAAMMPPNRQPLKEASYLAMYPNKARDLIDDKSEKYFDIGKTALNIDSKDILGQRAVKESLDFVVKELKNGRTVRIKNERNSYLLSTAESPAFLITNLTERNLRGFDISMDEALSLSTMERPFVLKLTENGLQIICFANDAVMLLLSKAATDAGVDALYIHQSSKADISLEYHGALSDAPYRKVVYFNGSDRFFVNEDFTAEKIQVNVDSLFFDLNISDDFGGYAIKEGVGSKKILSADFFCGNIWDELRAEFEFGKKLVDNFKSKLPDRFEAINSLDSNKMPTIQSFFAAMAAVLGIDGGFESVVLIANKANIAGGVKLDFTLSKNENGAVFLNLKKCFSSILSYKIAEVEDEVLAYSFFESAVDFLIISQDEIKKSFEAKKLHVGGEFLLSKVFVSKLKSKIKNIDIDMALNTIPSNLKGFYEIAK